MFLLKKTLHTPKHNSNLFLGPTSFEQYGWSVLLSFDGVRNHTLQAFTDNKSIRFNHCTTMPFIKVYYKVQFLITWLSSFGIIFCLWQIKRNSSNFLFFYFYPIFLEGKDNLQTKYDRKPTRITSLSHCVYSFHSNTTKIGGNSV